MNARTSQTVKRGSLLFAAACFVFSALAFVLFFKQLPIEGTTLGLDWQWLWHAIQDGNIRYEVGLALKNPPWTAVLIMPLGFSSMRASWGLVVFATIVVMVVSVPIARKKWLYWLSILLLVVSYPSLRHIADGNLEALVIGGALLILYGFNRQRPYILAIGILMILSKPQEAFLVVIVAGFYALQTFSRRFLLQTGMLILAITIPLMLWLGGPWLTTMLSISQRGSIMDMSLMASLNRTGGIPQLFVVGTWIVFLGATLVVMWVSRPNLTREKMGMLITASLLLSPYAAGDSLVTILAIGIIPLFQVRLLMGGLLIALINLPFLMNSDMLYGWSAYHSTAILLLSWGIAGWRILKKQDVSDYQVGSPAANQLSVERV